MKRILSICAVTALGMIPASGARAARFAAPMAHPMADPTVCAQAAPCDILTAVEHVSVVDGDDIVITPGTYTLGAADQIDANEDVVIHGQDGQPRPVLNSSAFNAIFLDNSAATPAVPTLRDVVINHTEGNTGLLMFGGLAERLIIQSTAAGACSPFSGTGNVDSVLRDSVCWNTGGGAGVSMGAGGAGILSTGANLRNVTAVGTGGGSRGIDLAAAEDVTVFINARNVIADGEMFDVQAVDDGDVDGTATATLTSSNYATENDPGDATVTDPGTNGNQTAAPLFVNAAMGDFHQAAGSPTIEAGTADGLLSSLDLDGNPRIIPATQSGPFCIQSPARPDIGAYEAPTSSFVSCDPGSTPQPSSKPRKKCKKRKKRPGTAKKKRCKRRKR